MPAGSLDSIAADTAFPLLTDAVGEGHILALLQNVLGLSDLTLTGIEVLNHKPGRRCTLRYRLASSQGEPLAVVAKWYRDLAEAQRLYQRQAWLAAEAANTGLSLAAVMGYAPEQGVIVQQHIAGQELRALPLAGDLLPFRLAGSWLGRLHQLQPSPLLEVKSLARELRKVDAWADEVLLQLPELVDELELLLEAMSRLRLSESAPVVLHRDFYPANLLWDGETVYGIDFDQMAQGDAAVDVGAFISQTEKLALRAGDVERAEPATTAFLGAYQEFSGQDSLGSRLALFRAYTLLHVASAEVRRRRQGWQELTRAFIQRANHAISL